MLGGYYVSATEMIGLKMSSSADYFDNIIIAFRLFSFSDSEDTEDHKNAIKADPQELARRRVPNQRRRRRRRLWEARRRSL